MARKRSPSPTGFPGFSQDLLHFLDDLRYHNNRQWFQENKSRYEASVREPALEFIRSMERPLKKTAPRFRAVAKKVGGSLMRVHRDTRFSKDKTPYKTNLGIHFRHELGKNVHAPGFYFHIESESAFVGAGIWHPDSETLKKIRASIVDSPAAWKRARNASSFVGSYELTGDSLQRAPRGFDPDHPQIVDIKRKDFIGICHLKLSDLTRPAIVETVAQHFAQARPFMRYLCKAIDVPF